MTFLNYHVLWFYFHWNVEFQKVTENSLIQSRLVQKVILSQKLFNANSGESVFRLDIRRWGKYQLWPKPSQSRVIKLMDRGRAELCWVEYRGENQGVIGHFSSYRQVLSRVFSIL